MDLLGKPPLAHTEGSQSGAYGAEKRDCPEISFSIPSRNRVSTNWRVDPTYSLSLERNFLRISALLVMLSFLPVLASPQPPASAAGGHLPPRLLQFGGTGKGLGYRLSSQLAGEAKIRAMLRLVELMAMTARLAARTVSGGNRATAEIRQFQEALQDGLALLFEVDEGLGHGAFPFYIARPRPFAGGFAPKTATGRYLMYMPPGLV